VRKLISVSVLAVLALPLSISTNNVFACGESVFRVGKGVHYRANIAPISGTVLVYARTDQERAIAEQLQQAGHSVQMVSTDGGLAIEMQTQKFDVIVAPYSKRDEVEAQSAQIANHPDWVPVVESGSADAKLARSQYGHAVSVNAGIRKYLKAIHQSLRVKST
jgi:hypothetical protein